MTQAEYIRVKNALEALQSLKKPNKTVAYAIRELADALRCEDDGDGCGGTDD